MKNLLKKQAASSMPPLDIEEEDVPHRDGNGPVWIAVLCVILAVALLVSSLPSAATSSSSVRSSVLNCQLDSREISTVLRGAGTLASQDGEDVTVPVSLEIKNYYVKNGQALSEGDPIAAFDPVEVQSAVSQLQSVLKDLDSAIASAFDSTPASTVQAGTSGRVKKIYAEKGTPVADTMYREGALMLLSLDGLMAVDLDTELTPNEEVAVTLSDGTELPGKVQKVADGISTVTVSDEKTEFGDSVTVAAESGKVLGTGTLYIHNMLRVTGLYGTVDSINVSLNRKVSNGTTLITLKDTGRTATYQSLLSRRAELEEQLDSLLQLGSDGILRAKETGIVSGVDSDIDYVSPGTLETRQRSHASPGYVKVSGALLDAPPAGGNESGDSGGSGGSGNENPGGENPGGDSGGGSGGENPGGGSGGENPGGGSGGGSGGQDPETPPTETATYTIGYVIQSGVYVPTGSVELAFGASFSASAVPTDVSGAVPIPGGKVYLCTGSGWTESVASAIRVGDTVAISGETIVYLPGSGGSGAAPTMPGGFDLSGLDLSGLMNGMTGGMSGFSGYSGFSTPSTPSYESYDTTQQTIVTLTGKDSMTVDFPVDELDILTLQVGMPAEVTLDALPGQHFSGTITKINTYGENSGGDSKFTVTVTLPREAEMLSGMNASVQITTAVSDSTRTLPAAAIQFQDGASWVYTSYDEKNDTLGGLTQVETGLSDGEQVEILTSFPEGTTFYYRYADSIEYRFER